MAIEEWFDRHQFNRDYDIGEKGVEFFALGDLDIDLFSSNCLPLSGVFIESPFIQELDFSDIYLF